MNETTTDPIYEQLCLKLHPNRITGSSAQMYYIISVLLGENWVTSDRGGGGFSITSDGFVTSGGVFIGTAGDFERNIRGYIDAAELDGDERAWVAKRYDYLVSDWRHARFGKTDSSFILKGS